MTSSQISFSVEGMTCDHCATTLRSALSQLPGVQGADVSFGDQLATLRVDASFAAGTALEAAAAQGYVVNEQAQSDLRRRGIHQRTSEAFDLVVIGSGGAAFGAALRASELGAKVAIVERGVIGGTCVNIGCVPSKSLIRAAEGLRRANHPRFAGIASEGRLTDFKALMRQKQSLVEELRQVKYTNVLAAAKGVSFIEGHARFERPGVVSVGEAELLADRFIVATGMRPHVADISGLAEAGFLTSTEALALETLPRSMIVLGGRFVALELAQAFARLGTQVTVVQRSAHVLPTEDDDVTEELQRLLSGEGLQILTGARALRATREGNERVVEVEHGGRTLRITAEQILVATGRRANTEDLGLPQIGVRLRADGTIEVDEALETSAPGIFAAGDVIGEPAFVYTAAYEGRLAADNALGTSKHARDYRALPAVLFTDPQLATVGLTEKQAFERGISIDVAKLPMSYVPRALAARDTRGFVKLIRERGSDRLVGAAILAPEAGDLIMEPALAIRHGIPVSELASAFHAYLTGAEAIKLAAQTFDRDVAKLSCCAA